MDKIYEKIDKALLQDMPRVTFPGRIIVLQAESEARRAVDALLAAPILGIDTETRPTFRRGVTHEVALLQVATDDTCFLFRLCRMGMPPCVVRFLEDKAVPKVGLSLKDDLLNLRRRHGFQAGAFIELQDEVKTLGIADMSLQKIYANLFHQKIAKRQQLTNWEADVLTPQQQEYAAIDAWACIHIYQKVAELARTRNFELIPAPQPAAPAEPQS